MRQNHVVILLVIVMFVGLMVYGWGSIQSLKSVSPSPTPSPAISFSIFSSTPQPTTAQSSNNFIINNINNNQSFPTSVSKINRQYSSFPGVLKQDQLANKGALIQTDKGNIGIEIYPEATMAASNFLILASNGFYDGLTFHRVDPGFVIQGGDPRGDGFGGPGYTFADEPVTRPYIAGTVAMANAGPNTNGSQFFIMLANHPELPPKYTIFGQVILGMDVVSKIQVGDVMRKVVIAPLR